MDKIDFAFIGAGIMSATMANLLKVLFPEKSIVIFERLNEVAQESSNAWNNAGTGHSGFCELNYTPIKEGKLDISKAVNVAEQFELSKQFWTYLIEQNILASHNLFIHSVPHCSLVFGDENAQFLQARVKSLLKNPLFQGMEISNNRETLSSWFPLMMEGRKEQNPVAASKMNAGTDIDFGLLTKELFKSLQKYSTIQLLLEHHVYDIDRNEDNSWKIEFENLHTNQKSNINATFVFVDAGGGALKLLNKAEIPEVEGYGGFPIGGKWLKCKNPAVIDQHHAKVYGLAEVGAPPMSVPHLDSRIIDHESHLLFGPYAGFSTKFLKKGSFLDFPESLDFDNILPVLEAGIYNLPLTQYLIEQVLMSFDDKFKELQKYYPMAKKDDWELIHAGQRVQIIKKDKKGNGYLEFGTEIVCTSDGTLSGILGASPGASTAAAIMLNVLKKMLPLELQNPKIIAKLKEIFPSYGISLSENPELLKQLRRKSQKVLQLND